MHERFTLLERIGAGGFGVVHRAHDRVQGIDVALKTMSEVHADALARFKREFRALAGLIHPNLVALHHLFAGDPWFFTMELIEGEPLLRHVRPPPRDTTETTEVEVPSGRPRRRGRPAGELDEERLRSALPQLVAGIDALHRAGKLHRDIKSSNVLVERGGRVVVCDFGLVVDFAASTIDRGGTPIYMSPEQAAGLALVEASDWYSVGVLLYEALTGDPPWTGTPPEMLVAKRGAPPPRPEGVSDDLADLCLALLRRSPLDRPGAAEILARLGAPPLAAPARGDFVGRDRELAALEEALEASRRGRSVTVLVDGPSGIGKTALCRRFVDQAARAGAILLEGRCYERESVPYKALDSMVDALAQQLVRRPAEEVMHLFDEDAAALARLFPVMRRIPVLEAHRQTAAPPVDPQRLRARAFAALREALAALGRARPTIVFIDDLQWGDADSAAFLLDLVHAPRQVPVLLVASFRSGDEAAPLVRALLAPPPVRAGDLRRLTVAPLGDDDAAALARVIVGDPARATAIAAGAGGHPFLVALLAEAGDAAAGGGIEAEIQRRIDRLPADARALLAASALAGVPTPVDLLGTAAGVEAGTAALAPLREARLVRERMRGAALEIEPFHDRIRVLAAAGLDDAEARRIHRRLAEAREASGKDDPNALVEHWLGAGDVARAAHHAERAARLAEEILAFARAAHHLGLVLALAPLEPAARRALEARRGRALANAGDLTGAAGAFLAGAAGAEPDVALDLRRLAVEHLLRSGARDDGLRLAREVAGEVGLAIPSSRRAAIRMVVIGRARLALRGLGLREPRGPIDPEVLRRLDVGTSVAAGLTFVDPLAGAAVQVRNVLGALEAGDPGRAGAALALEVGFRGSMGASGRAAAERFAAVSHDYASRVGDGALLGWVTGGVALTAFCCGDFAAALDGSIAGERQMSADPVRFRWQIDLAQVYRTAALFWLGRLEQLTRLMPLLLREAADRGDVYLVSALRAWRSNVTWLILDEPAEARRHLAEGTLHRVETRFHLHHYYRLLGDTQADLYEGDAATAWVRLDGVWTELEGSGLMRMQFVRIESLFLRARAALAADQLDEAERCARAIEKERRPWSDALAAVLRAGIARRHGDDDAAAAGLALAIERCDAAQMRHLAAAARWRLGQLLGGERGAEELRAAASWFATQQVGNAERLVALLAP